MFAADADFQLGLDAATFADAHFDELAYADLVEDFEGIGLDDAVFLVEFEELGSIVTREAEGHLGEVVGAEGEEVGYGGNLVGGERCTRYFDHGAYEVGQALALLFEDFGGGGVDDVCLVLDFFERSYQRYHNLGVYIDAASAYGEGCLDDGACLHLGDFGVGDTKTATAVSEHGVEFFERINFGFDFFECDAHFVGQFFLGDGLVGYELVQRGVEQADGYAKAVHGFEDAFEVAALHGQELGQGHVLSILSLKK